MLVIGRKDHAGAARRTDHAPCVVDRERERLLAQHVLAGGDGGGIVTLGMTGCKNDRDAWAQKAVDGFWARPVKRCHASKRAASCLRESDGRSR